MGEVFVGCNVNTDEKVAIKVMLPALASDEKVIAMFRKEARTLTKLNHPALVQYRVLAQEPTLHVLYIVTDFIEGTNLSVALGTLKPSPDELAGLLRRLASGLAAAHALGAIHRDMSPDNVILENDDIHEATIIDFGIAKDLDVELGDDRRRRLRRQAQLCRARAARRFRPRGRPVDRRLQPRPRHPRRRAGQECRHVGLARRRHRQAPQGAGHFGDPGQSAAARPRHAAARSQGAAALDGGCARRCSRARRIPSPTTVRAEVAEEAARPPEPVPDYQETYEAAAEGGSSKPLLIVLAVLLALAAVLAVIWYVTDGTFGLGGGRAATSRPAAEPRGARVRRLPPAPR